MTGAYTETRREARQAAKAACTDYVLIPPEVEEMTFNNGHLNAAIIKNLDGNSRNWESSCDNWGLTKDDINWFFGYECEADLTNERKVKTVLTIWGIYYGGETQADFEVRYNLTPTEFTKIAEKDFVDLEIQISDNFNFVRVF